MVVFEYTKRIGIAMRHKMHHKFWFQNSPTKSYFEAKRKFEAILNVFIVDDFWNNVLVTFKLRSNKFIICKRVSGSIKMNSSLVFWHIEMFLELALFDKLLLNELKLRSHDI